MNFFDHKDLGNHLLKLCPKVVNRPVCVCAYLNTAFTRVKVHIPGVSRLMDIPAGGYFLALCDQKSSYKHLYDFGRLRSYGPFLIPVHALVWTVLRKQLAGDVLNLEAYRLRCKHYFSQLTRPPISKQSSFLRYLRNAGKVGCLGIRLARIYCMRLLLPRVQKNLSLTLQGLCRHLMLGTVRR